MRKVWYGYSNDKNAVQFFDADPGNNNGQLVGTGSFTIDAIPADLNVQSLHTQGTASRQQPTD